MCNSSDQLMSRSYHQGWGQTHVRVRARVRVRVLSHKKSCVRVRVRFGHGLGHESMSHPSISDLNHFSCQQNCDFTQNIFLIEFEN